MRLGFALFFWIWIPIAAAAGETKNPSIQIENPMRDVGALIQGETIRQVFVIANQGSGTLEILNVAHS
jgi:hypothetical protein